jgi:hypothetical protein
VAYYKKLVELIKEEKQKNKSKKLCASTDGRYPNRDSIDSNSKWRVTKKECQWSNT